MSSPSLKVFKLSPNSYFPGWHKGLVLEWTISLICVLPRVESREKPSQKTPLPAEGTLTDERRVGFLGHRLVLGKEGEIRSESSWLGSGHPFWREVVTEAGPGGRHEVT